MTNDALLFGELGQLVPVLSLVSHAVELVPILSRALVFRVAYNVKSRKSECTQKVKGHFDYRTSA